MSLPNAPQPVPPQQSVSPQQPVPPQPPGPYQQPVSPRQPVPAQQPQAAAAVAVTTKFMPLSFFLFFVKPAIVINGARLAVTSWGRIVIPLVPGQHHLRVFTPYFLPPELGPAELVVSLAPGQLLELEYRAPLVAWSGGSLGTPPQKYRGAWGLWLMLGMVVLLMLCFVGQAALTTR